MIERLRWIGFLIVFMNSSFGAWRYECQVVKYESDKPVAHSQVAIFNWQAVRFEFHQRVWRASVQSFGPEVEGLPLQHGLYLSSDSTHGGGWVGTSQLTSNNYPLRGLLQYAPEGDNGRSYYDFECVLRP